MAWTLTRPDTGETHTFENRPVYSQPGGGWTVDGLVFMDPAGDGWTLTAPTKDVIDVPTFLMRFHPQERVAIRQSADPLIVDFLGLVDDPRVQNVNLAHPSVQGAVMYMALVAAPPLIETSRVAEILAPEPIP